MYNVHYYKCPTIFFVNGTERMHKLLMWKIPNDWKKYTLERGKKKKIAKKMQKNILKDVGVYSEMSHFASFLSRQSESSHPKVSIVLWDHLIIT